MLAQAQISQATPLTQPNRLTPNPQLCQSVFAGSDEGAFAWLTLNYLLGFLGKDGADTMAAIDLGGGSVQEAFALTDAQATAAPDPLYVTQLSGGGRTYSVYVHRQVLLLCHLGSQNAVVFRYPSAQ